MIINLILHLTNSLSTNPQRSVAWYEVHSQIINSNMKIKLNPFHEFKHEIKELQKK